MSTSDPVGVFPPGELIRDELEAREWTQNDLAKVMGRPLQMVNEIIGAKKRVTEETARELELALGIDAEIWVRIEAMYRLHLTKKGPSAIARRAALRKRTQVSQLMARKWIAPSEDIDEQEANVLAFLGVPSLDKQRPLAMAAKQTVYNQPLSAAQEAWLIRASQLAETMIVQSFDDEKLLAAVDDLRELLVHPDDAYRVPQILASAGVRFLIIEQLPGLKVDGVCFWLSPVKPVIAMSLVHDRIDNFWFVLRHEIEHVLNGDGQDAAIVDNDLDKRLASEPEEERIANRAAAEFCVPQGELESFIARKGPVFSDVHIRQFAHTINRHPGLVAGQLRRKLEAWNMYTKHIAKIRHVIVQTALVDGFGATPTVHS